MCCACLCVESEECEICRERAALVCVLRAWSVRFVVNVLRLSVLRARSVRFCRERAALSVC